MNQLKVHAIDDDGAWLKAGREEVLLPKYELTAAIRLGEMLDVFVYADGSGNLVATLRQPMAEVGEFALMRASQVNVHGAFMDWGLTKDLLVPLKEQAETMKIGRQYLVNVRLDRQGRPIGTARLDKCLSAVDNTIGDGEEVDLIIWEPTDLGVKVIINHRFGGLLYHDEVGDHLKYGDQLKGYIRLIRPDGKIDCTLRKGGKADRDDAKDKIIQALLDHQGFLPLHDKSPPEQIQNMLGMSKKLFKKGLGSLYKSGLVEFIDDGVRLKPEPVSSLAHGEE
jgi:predicted RNA-binding protein (virulence factor B family)